MTMRHILLLSCLFMMSLTGCAPKPETVSATSVEQSMLDSDLGTLPDDCLKKAERAVSLFRFQKWNDYRELFQPELRKHLTNDVLQKAWSDYISPSGAYIETIASDVLVQQHNVSAEVITRFQNKVLLALFTFDKKGYMTAMQFPVYDDNTKWAKCNYDCIFDAERFSKDFRAKDWSQLRKQFSEELAQNTTDTQLNDLHDITFSALGNLVTLISRKGEKKGTETIVTHFTRYEKGSLILMLHYNQEARVQKFKTQVVPNVQKESIHGLVRTSEYEHYTEETLSFAANPEFPLNAVLTLPKSKDPVPVVIFLSGSGPNDKDETLGPNKPFRDIAAGLALRGIASLRFDKRTLTHGKRVDPTIETEYMDDLKAALDLVSADSRFHKTFVLGHSLGGCLIPAIAVKYPNLDGVISIAGSMRPLAVIATQQIHDQLADAKATLSQEEYEKIEQEAKPMLEELAIASALPEDMPEDKILFMAPLKYWRSLKPYQDISLVPQVKIPFFIAQGAGDIQVTRDEDYAIWEKTACPLQNVTCKLYEDLNHLMMPTQGYKHAEEYEIPSRVSENFIQDLANFILK